MRIEVLCPALMRSEGDWDAVSSYEAYMFAKEEERCERMDLLTPEPSREISRDYLSVP